MTTPTARPRGRFGDPAPSGGREASALSVVVPVFDEAGSLRTLHAEIVEALASTGVEWEAVYVDDGSRDGSAEILAALAGEDARVRVIAFDRNRGQSTALLAGFDAARAPWVATLDADGQNDPRDLVALWEIVSREPVDGVIGVRVERKDDWVRRISSRVANAVRNRVLGDDVTDVGCSTRIVSREALRSLPRFEGMHRFLPTLVRSAGYTLSEVPVHHRPRTTGESKYGVHDRLWRGLADLWRVRRLVRSARRAPSRRRP